MSRSNRGIQQALFPEPSKARPQSVDEVRAYARDINSPIDPDEFYDKQEMTGWTYKSGDRRYPLSDWKAAFRTWTRNARKYGDAPRFKQAVIDPIGSDDDTHAGPAYQRYRG